MSIATQQGLPTGTWTLDPIHSSAGFAVRHMVVATFRGGFEELDARLTVGDDGEARLEGTVKADSIVVKDENLAAHLKSPDFFDTAQHPEIRFVSTSLRRVGDALLLEGDLTVKGRTHPITARGGVVGPHEDIAGATKVGVTLETVIDRTKFGLSWNAPLPRGGFALANDVTLVVELELAREA